ncbi:MAG TPA: hypothetical protein VHW90_00250 [Stellaceae bacterium]|jgi:uncharacterized protein (DUF983 family)|nr:hypothetical protein [Stellaceae bacterium]
MQKAAGFRGFCVFGIGAGKGIRTFDPDLGKGEMFQLFVLLFKTCSKSMEDVNQPAATNDGSILQPKLA